MRIIISIICFIIFSSFCSIAKAGVHLPFGVLGVSLLFYLAIIIFAQKVFPVERNKIMSYVLAFYYCAFLNAAAFGAMGTYPDLAKAFYVFSLIVMLIAGVAIYVLHHKKIMFNNFEYRNALAIYGLGFGFANFYAGWF